VLQTLTNPLTAERTTGRYLSMTQQWDAPAPLRLWHLASLDAPTVAVVWALGFAWAADVRLPVWIPAILALVAWTIYVADRILDAHYGLRAGESDRLRLRHHFHWRYRRILILLAVSAACAAAVSVLVLMPPAALERNSVLAAAAMAYFTRVHSRPSQSPVPPSPLSRFLSLLLSKELLVALLFTTACVLPAWSRSNARTAFCSLLAPAIFFALLAWLNCRAIERWESAPKLSVKLQILPLAGLLALVGIGLATVLSFTLPGPAALLAAGAASTLLLALLDILRNRLSPLALRVAADLVLLTPILLIPFASLHR
jgi:hypothetical protein